MNKQKGFSAILGIIIGLLVISSGAYYFISTDNTENGLKDTDINTTEENNTSEEIAEESQGEGVGQQITGRENAQENNKLIEYVKNGYINSMKFVDGVNYSDCADFINAGCSYPDERFKTVISPFIVTDEKEIIFLASTVNGNNFGSPVLWRIVYDRDDTDNEYFRIAYKIPLKYPGEVNMVSRDKDTVVVSIEKTWDTLKNTYIQNITLPPVGYKVTNMEYFAFKRLNGWSTQENSTDIILTALDNLDTEEDYVIVGDKISIKYILGNKYESNDAKKGVLNIEKKNNTYKIEQSSERTGEIVTLWYDENQLSHLKDISDKPVLNGIKRWKTYVIPVENGFIELNITGSGDTKALDELIENSMFVSG